MDTVLSAAICCAAKAPLPSFASKAFVPISGQVPGVVNNVLTGKVPWGYVMSSSKNY